MIELKRATMQIITSINKDWQDAITKSAENQEPLDLSGMIASFSEKIQKLDEAFAEAQQRIKKPGRKGFFG